MLPIACTLKFSCTARMCQYTYMYTLSVYTYETQLFTRCTTCGRSRMTGWCMPRTHTVTPRRGRAALPCRCAVRVRLCERAASRLERAEATSRVSRPVTPTNQRCPPRVLHARESARYSMIDYILYIPTFMHILVWTALRVQMNLSSCRFEGERIYIFGALIT